MNISSLKNEIELHVVDINVDQLPEYEEKSKAVELYVKLPRSTDKLLRFVIYKDSKDIANMHVLDLKRKEKYDCYTMEHAQFKCKARIEEETGAAVTLVPGVTTVSDAVTRSQSEVQLSCMSCMSDFYSKDTSVPYCPACWGGQD